MHTYIYIYIYILCICTYAYAYIHIYICMHTGVWFRTSRLTALLTCGGYLHVSVYMCRDICLYTYTYIYIYTSAYIHIRMYAYRRVMSNVVFYRIAYLRWLLALASLEVSHQYTHIHTYIHTHTLSHFVSCSLFSVSFCFILSLVPSFSLTHSLALSHSHTHSLFPSRVCARVLSLIFPLPPPHFLFPASPLLSVPAPLAFALALALALSVRSFSLSFSICLSHAHTHTHSLYHSYNSYLLQFLSIAHFLVPSSSNSLS